MLLFVGEWHAVTEAAVEVVGGEVEIAHLFFVAVAVGIGAFFGEGITVAQVAVAVFVGEVERLDLGFFEGEQFVFLTDTVLIAVTPDTQVSESVVGSIHLAVAVVIKVGQCLIAVGGAFAVFEQGVVAEKLAAVIDNAVAIAVINKQAVVLADPAGSSADAVLVVVKERAFMAVAGKGFDAVAVQIKGEGVVQTDEHIAEETEPVSCHHDSYSFPIFRVFEKRGNFASYIIKYSFQVFRQN